MDEEQDTDNPISLDLTQLQHTMLASLQPFLHDALLALRGGAVKDAAAGITTSDSKARPQEEARMRAGFGSSVAAAGGSLPGGLGEDDYEEELADSSTLAALPPVELATSCLKLLLKLQWAMHCRAQVCALMLRLVQLQAQPQQLTSFVSPGAPVSASTSAPAPAPTPVLAPTAAAGACIAGGAGSVGPDTARDGSQSLVHPGGALSSGQIHISPRSFSYSPVGHRSFRDYIQHMAGGTVPPGQPVQADMLMQHQQQQQQADLRPAQHPQQPSQHIRHQQRETGSVCTPGNIGPIRAAAGPGVGGSSAALRSVSLPPSQQMDPLGELEHVQGSLMAWTAALVRADVFHSSNELQGCVLTVLGVVKTCPLVLVTALNRALERREILNKALAEQVRRLQRSVAQPPAVPPPAAAAAASSVPQTRVDPPVALPPTSESAAVGPTAAAVGGGGGGGDARWSVFSAGGAGTSFRLEGPARVGSLVLPGGALAPAPSLAAAPDYEIAAHQASATADSMPPALGAISSSTRDRAGSFALPGLPLGRLGSIAKRGMVAADSGLGAVAEAVDCGGGDDDADGDTGPPQPQPPQADRPASLDAPALMAVPPCATAELQTNVKKAVAALPASEAAIVTSAAPAENKSISCSSSSNQMHPVQLAVAMAQADIHIASLKLLEYYADPSGAMPSGLSNTAAAAAGGGYGGISGGAQPALGNDTGRDFRCAGCAPADTAARTPPSPSAAVAAVGNNSSSNYGSGRKEHRRARPLSRSQTVSRGTSHSTLLQCLVCELVRTAHSVTASVSWRATLEGGRGLAGCFVHPILHGGSSAAVASFAAAAAAAAGTGCKRRCKTATAAATSAAAKSRTVWTETAIAEEVEAGGLGSVPGFVPGAEGAQALLLSLLDVRQWGSELKQLPVPSAQDRKNLSAMAGRGGGRPMAEAAAAAVAEEDDELEEAGGVAAEMSDLTDPRVTDDDGRSYDGGARPFSLGSGPGTTGRLSFSGLTDGDNDSGSYPTPTAPTARSIEAKTPRERGQVSMRHHTNPAFGLHSPTPSNISEFWEEASDLTSPESTIAPPLPAESRRPSGAVAAATDVRMYWRAGSSPVLTEGGPSPQSTRSPSPELPMSGGSRFGSGTEGRRTRAGVDGAVSPGTIASSPASTPESIKLVNGHSPRQGATKSTGDDGGGGRNSSSGDVQSSAVCEEVKQRPAASASTLEAVAATSNGAAEGHNGDGGTGEPEQPPTLSYLVNVQTLAEIRRAVREAHGDKNADGDDSNAAMKFSGITTPVRMETGASPAVASASSRAGGSGGAAATATASAAAVAGDLSLPLVGERSCSFSVVQAASSATSMSEISVRRGVSGILGTGVWPNLEPHDEPYTDPRVFRESVGMETANAANASISISDAVAAAAAAGLRRGSEAERTRQTARVESDLTFASSPASPTLVEFRAAGGKEIASGASPALTLPPSASVTTAAAGGCDHSPPYSALSLSSKGGCVGAADPGAFATLPRLHATPHSPLQQRPESGGTITTITSPSSTMGTPGGGGGGGGGRNVPSSPPLPSPLSDSSAGQASGYHHQQHLGASSPSAGSAASSISLASPRLATASGSGTSVPQQSYGYTSSHGGLLLASGSGPQVEMPPNHVNARGSPAGHHQPQLQQQPHPTPLRRVPQKSAAAGAAAGDGGGVLRRSTSASATTASASRIRSLSPPPLPPPPFASPLTPALRTVSHDSPVSTATSPSVDRIQIQDFLREPSTSSSLSPRALGSEFFRTPGSAGTSTTKSTTPSVTSAGLGTGREANNFTVSPATMSTAPSPSASTSVSTSAAAAAAKAQASPDRQLHRSRASLGSSTTRPGFGARKPSIDAHANPTTRVDTISPRAGKSSDVVAFAATGKHLHPHQPPQQHPPQLVYSSREGSSTWGHTISRRRRPSYEAEQLTKAAAQKAVGISGGGASPGVSGGGAALNPLYSGAHAVAVLGGGGHAAEQLTSGQSAVRVSGVVDAPRGGAGPTAGRGPRLHSARGGVSNRTGTGRAAWH